MKPLGPIFTVDLLPKLDQKLIALLRTLKPEDWEKQTIAPKWQVKDIVGHLLDGNLRFLSMARDQYFGEQPAKIDTYQDLVDYLNQLNADWTKALKRVSPALLIELLAITGQQYTDYLKTLQPFDKALFSVAWAGETESENWFHIAREYTEKWHHQQQIRLAVGQEQELYTKEFYYPHLDTSMRALPHHYRHIQEEKGAVIQIKVSGAGGGTWQLYADGFKWHLVTGSTPKPICTLELDGEIAWRLFTKGITKEAAVQKTKIYGRQDLGHQIFSMLAVMA